MHKTQLTPRLHATEEELHRSRSTGLQQQHSSLVLAEKPREQLYKVVVVILEEEAVRRDHEVEASADLFHNLLFRRRPMEKVTAHWGPAAETTLLTVQLQAQPLDSSEARQARAT